MGEDEVARLVSSSIGELREDIRSMRSELGELRGEIGQLKGQIQSAQRPCEIHDKRLRVVEQAQASNKAAVAIISSLAPAGGGGLAMLISRMFGP